MKIISTFVLIGLLATSTLNAQNFEWAKAYGNFSTDYGYSICTDAAGNVYATGTFLGSIDFDAGVGVNILTGANCDVYVLKMDPSGNFLWAKSFGGTSIDAGSSIKTDTYGNIYITGGFHESVDFDPGTGTTTLTSAGYQDVFVQKMDSAGNFLWARSFGGPSYDKVSSISIDASGNVYTTGTFQETMTFDTGAGDFTLTSGGYTDIFVFKMDCSGNFIWAKSFSGTLYDNGNGIINDASGNVYITGSFQDTIDFDPGAGTSFFTSTGCTDVFVQKMDSAGNLLWVKTFDGADCQEASSISMDEAGNIYTTGGFQGTVDFDPEAGTHMLVSAGNDDIFIQKMDSAGNFLWAKSFGSTSNDRGFSINSDAYGNLYTTGCFSEYIDFSYGTDTAILTSAGSFDVFVLKMDSSGNFLWAESFGGTSNDYGNSIHVDSSGNVYTIGHFMETADFNPGTGTTVLSSQGDADFFVHKMSQSTSSESIFENDFGNTFIVYPNPTNGNFSIDLGNVYQNTTISIFDIDGKLIKKMSFQQTQIANMSVAAPAGVYLVKVSSGDKKATFTLVKE